MENQENTRNKDVYVVLGVLCVAVVALTISYAALSAQLNINMGSVSQSAQTWNVGFVSGNATAKKIGTSGTGLTCGTASVTNDTVTVADSTISKPGDGCVYELTVKNSGTIDANLATITPSKPESTECTTSAGSTMVCGNITYKLTTDEAGVQPLTTNVALASSQQQKVYLTAEYTGTNLSNGVIQKNAGFTLVYNQK